MRGGCKGRTFFHLPLKRKRHLGHGFMRGTPFLFLFPAGREGLNISLSFFPDFVNTHLCFPRIFWNAEKDIFFSPLARSRFPHTHNIHEWCVSFPPLFFSRIIMRYFSLSVEDISVHYYAGKRRECVCVFWRWEGGEEAPPTQGYGSKAYPSHPKGGAGYTVWERKRRIGEGKKESTYGNRQVFRCCSIKVKKVLIWSLRIYCT